MGKSETASAAIGIKILLSELVSQINESNFHLIKKMLYDGCIEDMNDYYNEAYKIILGHDVDNDELPQTYNEFKYCITEQFKLHVSYYKSRFGNNVEPDISRGCLLEKELLVPIKYILETERWGYERYGVNSTSRPLDFDLSLDLKEYEEIKNFKVVFIIKQHSG
jgi:hypothetical protein